VAWKTFGEGSGRSTKRSAFRWVKARVVVDGVTATEPRIPP